MSVQRIEGQRVLYVLKRYPQLSQTFVVREIAQLERAGVHVGIDALAPRSGAPVHTAVASVAARVRYLPKHPRLRDRDVRGVHLRLGLRRPLTWLRLARDARSGDWRRFVQAGLVADRIRRQRFHHVHAHFASAACEVSRDAAALAGCAYTVTAHAKDIFHADHVPHLTRRVHSAAAVVTVSSFNQQHLSATLPGATVVHVPNSVSLAAECDRPAGGPVLCVARLVPKKGVDTLIRAIAVLGQSHPQIEAEIIGDGELAASLAELTTELGCADRVHFRGAQLMEQVELAYRSCSMLVLPCRIDEHGDRDGLPTVIVEAFAHAVPVVSTSIIGIPEVVRHGETGLLVEPDDPQQLAEAIVELWADPQRAASMGRAGRRLVAEQFDPERSARMLAGVFSGVGVRR